MTEINTTIRCYRTQCKNNNFDKSNCGYCRRESITITEEGCMDFI